jgi:xylulokinase
MTPSYLLGVDIGTYESKGVITRVDGELVGVQVRPHTLSIPRPGWAEHDPEAVWWQGLVDIVQRLFAATGVSPQQIRALGISAIAPDLLPVDNAFRPLRRGAILYGIDTRAAQEIDQLNRQVGEELVFQRCGNSLSAQAVGPKLLWLKGHEPDVFAEAARFVTATTFLVGRLTGQCVIDHLTASTWVPLYDFAAQAWGDLGAEIVETARLPEIRWCTDVAGTVTEEAARQTGLAAGTPVIVGTADAAAEAVSVGVVAPGQMMLMYGSTIFMYAVQAEPKMDRRLWAAPYVFPRTSSLAAGMSTGGALTRWFRDHFAADLVAGENATGTNAYAQLAQAAEQVPPGAEALLVLPYFSGERTPINDPRALGMEFGLTLAHTRAHVFRAILEGVAYGIRHNLEVMQEIGAKPQQIMAVGGGTRNPLWLQIVSDVCNVPQVIPEITLGASYGDAFLAGLGTGVFSSFSDINRWTRYVKTVNPNPAHSDLYSRYFDLYLDLYRTNKPLMHQLGTMSATAAPARKQAT